MNLSTQTLLTLAKLRPPFARSALLLFPFTGEGRVNAGITVGCLFLAWDHFQDQLKGISLDLPESAPGYPDFLKELKGRPIGS